MKKGPQFWEPQLSKDRPPNERKKEKNANGLLKLERRQVQVTSRFVADPTEILLATALLPATLSGKMAAAITDVLPACFLTVCTMKPRAGPGSLCV